MQKLHHQMQFIVKISGIYNFLIFIEIDVEKNLGIMK